MSLPTPPEPDPNPGETEDYQPSGPQVRPWVRFLARFVDGMIFSAVAGPILFVIEPSFFYIPALELVSGSAAQNAQPNVRHYLLTPLLLFAYVFVEPLMLKKWGTTPGRAFLKVRLRNRDGSRLDYRTALNRSWEVWIRGEGFGIPYVTWITQLLAYFRLTTRGITSWDEAGEFTVSHQVIGPIRSLALASILTAILYLVYLTMAAGA